MIEKLLAEIIVNDSRFIQLILQNAEKEGGSTSEDQRRTPNDPVSEEANP